MADDELIDVLAYAQGLCEVTLTQTQKSSSVRKRTWTAQLAESKVDPDVGCGSKTASVEYLMRNAPRAVIPCLCKPGALSFYENDSTQPHIWSFLAAAAEAHSSLCSSKQYDLKEYQRLVRPYNPGFRISSKP